MNSDEIDQTLYIVGLSKVFLMSALERLPITFLMANLNNFVLIKICVFIIKLNHAFEVIK